MLSGGGSGPPWPAAVPSDTHDCVQRSGGRRQTGRHPTRAGRQTGGVQTRKRRCDHRLCSSTPSPLASHRDLQKYSAQPVAAARPPPPMSVVVAARLWLMLFNLRTSGALQGSTFSLPDNYAKWEPPIGPDGEPVNVQLSMHILDVVLDEAAQTVKFDSYFRTFWVENRIIFKNMTRPVIQMDTEVTTKLWLPNIFALFVQKVEKPELIVPAAGVHLYEDKLIFRSSLYLTTVKCNLLYFNYPMDRQTCTVKIQSYAYTSETLTIEWHPKGITREDIVMSSFYLEDIRTLPPVRVGVFNNSHAELRFEMRFKRKLRFSILAVYVPSLLVVMVSWLSLWVRMLCGV
ncbi:gamma-aminobutyric acid receptor subunit rho-2-like [Amphibalanus amphitrite]|uniref:gamma-aminobutyric acid receptor subunit rho-2-like n=1 Tax=Amphibalanus amphitrite TaxID=1232801 RepID=UPI001C910451|nr:gamma-aminobutyric acid receptor subunit rho-2-like [Amphibalanus amphitrite]